MRRSLTTNNGDMACATGLWVILLLSLLWHPAEAACYFPSKRLAPNDIPCRDDTEHSFCCGQGYACLSNGICQATGKEREQPNASEFVRGSCTDKDWRSSSCPLFCIDEQYDFLDGGNGIMKCTDTDEDLYMCIDSRPAALSSCPQKKGTLFFPGTPSVLTTIGVPQQTSTSTKSTVSTSSTSTFSTSTISTSLSQSTSDSTRAASTQEGETNSPPTSSPPSSNLGPIIGGAVGGVAAIAIAGVAGWLLARKRKTNPNGGNVKATVNNGSTPAMLHHQSFAHPIAPHLDQVRYGTPVGSTHVSSVRNGSPGPGPGAGAGAGGWKPPGEVVQMGSGVHGYEIQGQQQPRHEMSTDRGYSELPAWSPVR